MVKLGAERPEGAALQVGSAPLSAPPEIRNRFGIGLSPGVSTMRLRFFCITLNPVDAQPPCEDSISPSSS